MAITAQVIIERIQQKLGSGWKNQSVDAFLAGNRDSDVKGIVTTYAPSLEVLRKAAAGGKNLIISRESPFWARAVAGGGGGRGLTQATLEHDPLYRIKRDYIAANNLIVYRFFDNWNARQPDAQLQGLAKALGWEKYYKPSGGEPWATNNGFFAIPPATLKATAQSIKKTLKMKSIRVGGNADIRVTKAALSHGMYWLTDLRKLLAEPGVDLVVLGEPQWENELSLYNFDLDAAGQKKGMIVLGQQVSEEPGCGEMAAWLKSFIGEVPIEWIPTGEPSWMPY
jgi:putative NIF3 family GTP cyclohydrolase 1 type 2